MSNNLWLEKLLNWYLVSGRHQCVLLNEENIRLTVYHLWTLWNSLWSSWNWICLEDPFSQIQLYIIQCSYVWMYYNWSYTCYLIPRGQISGWSSCTGHIWPSSYQDPHQCYWVFTLNLTIVTRCSWLMKVCTVQCSSRAT